MGQKYIDNSWDFRAENTKGLTHCFHNYPAMMIPQVANRLIDKYGRSAKLLFDPYCGTGTSLVEANLKDISAVGTDLNPLARLIAAGKTTPIDEQTLDLFLKDFNDRMFRFRFGMETYDSAVTPTFKNIDYWFTKDVQKRLAVIKEYTDSIENFPVRQFFQIAFSETVRETSLTKNSEFKLFRMSEKQMERFSPDVFGIMEQKLSRNRRGLISYIKEKKNGASSAIFSFNTVYEIPQTVLSSNSVDLVVTSPPYGDSRTTVAYGQFSRLANQWMGYEDASKVDNELMGGKVKKSYRFDIERLNKTIEQIAGKDEKRARDVISFYDDYMNSINNVSKVLKTGGYACYVVGNRRVKGVTIQTDEITRNIFERNGFEHLETIIRNIPNKRMPSKNSPTNIVGKSDTTMKNEYIVVMRKK
jgi:DNA modification methylase